MPTKVHHSRADWILYLCGLKFIQSCFVGCQLGNTDRASASSSSSCIPAGARDSASASLECAGVVEPCQSEPKSQILFT